VGEERKSGKTDTNEERSCASSSVLAKLTDKKRESQPRPKRLRETHQGEVERGAEAPTIDD